MYAFIVGATILVLPGCVSMSDSPHLTPLWSVEGFKLGAPLEGGNVDISTPIINRGTIYAVIGSNDDDTQIAAFDLRTGERRWTSKASASEIIAVLPDRIIISSLTGEGTGLLMDLSRSTGRPPGFHLVGNALAVATLEAAYRIAFESAIVGGETHIRSATNVKRPEKQSRWNNLRRR